VGMVAFRGKEQARKHGHVGDLRVANHERPPPTPHSKVLLPSLSQPDVLKIALRGRDLQSSTSSVRHSPRMPLHLLFRRLHKAIMRARVRNSIDSET
jgi:hypothetical protein